MSTTDVIQPDQNNVSILLFSCCIVGIIYAAVNTQVVSKVDQESPGEWDAQFDGKLVGESIRKMQDCERKISEGAITFLTYEYKIISVFCVIFAVIIYCATELQAFPYATIAFAVGALTSIVCGYLGMKIAVYANVRTTFMAVTLDASIDKNYEDAFKLAFRSGTVMGFLLTSIGLLVFYIMFLVYQSAIGLGENTAHMMESLAGYGLGGSTIALFGRVGGGIQTKAADMGADLVGKVNHSMEEDDPNNPATIADNVGDNVGDIAGMGSDLFGSFAESTCAALVIAASSPEISASAGFLLFPLTITATGIIVSFLVSFLALHMKVGKDTIERALKIQLVTTTLIMIPVMQGLSVWLLPKTFTFNDAPETTYYSTGPFQSALAGCISGMIIGLITEQQTSYSQNPVFEMIENCKSKGGNAATNIVYGLALGYMSCIVPVICLAITIFIAHTFSNMQGIALAALGMLSTMSTALTIDAFGPICDNAGGIAEMSLGTDDFKNTRKVTDKLDAAGNTTAAIGKGFAIGSAALVSLALFSAFVTRAKLNNTKETNILHPLVFSGLLLGALLPYWFSGLTVKSVGVAAQEMCKVADHQIREFKEKGTPIDPNECIEVSTKYSLREMILPGLLVLGSPLVIGYLFGPSALAGLLAGGMVSGVQMAISMSNSGGAFDNCKKGLEHEGLKKEDSYKQAVIGDTVGDPLKDTSGPSLNILMKLMAITSLVFATSITEHGGVLTNWLK